MSLRIRPLGVSFAMVLTILVLQTSCAEMTDPSVRAYIHEKKAYTMIKNNQLSEANKELKLALRDTPREPSILNNMAYIEYKENHYQKALGFLEQARAVRQQDNDIPYIMNESRLLILHKHYKKALELLFIIKQKPINLWPKGYRRLMAVTLMRNNRLSEAVAVLMLQKDFGQTTWKQPKYLSQQ